MSKTTIFILLILVLVVGVLGFWYITVQNFSKEILSLQISGPQTASVGDEIEYVVTYKNNGNFVLQQPQLIFQLPDNSLTEDSQLRLSQNLKDIYPGQQATIFFKTRLLGKEGDIKTASASLSYVPKNLSARYEADATFNTKIDSVPITLNFNLPANAEPGMQMTYTINYFSNIDYPLENMSIKVDPINTVTVESANPASLDNIEWKLPTLNKAQGGTITIKDLLANNVANSLHFFAHLGMWQDGTFIVIKDISQDVSTGNVLAPVSAPVVNSANLTLTQKAYYSSQAGIDNSGPIPPQVNATTTYVINWQVNNNGDNLNNVKVSATLPEGVNLVDNLSPDDQADNFSYNNASRKVVWSLGNLGAGSLPSLYFQVALTPNQSMQENVITILGPATITGQDPLTGAVISHVAPAVNTNLSDDQSNSGKGIVQ